MHLVLIRYPILAVYLTPAFSLIGATSSELHSQMHILQSWEHRVKFGISVFRYYRRTVGRIGILARHGMFASFSGPLLHNHNHVAHASIEGESGKK